MGSAGQFYNFERKKLFLISSSVGHFGKTNEHSNSICEKTLSFKIELQMILTVNVTLTLKIKKR